MSAVINPVVNYAVGKYNEVKTALHSLKAEEGERVVHGYAAYAPTLALRPYAYVAPKLQPGEVEIKIEYCGLCYSDVSMINDSIISSKYPFIPGHEIIGKISAIGDSVDQQKFQIGQRVGVGWMRESCHHCNYCEGGKLDHMCEKSVGTIESGNNGGFADYIRVDSGWTFSIPENLPSDTVPPLMCAGITVYSPLKRFGATRGGLKVALIGMGGLGHLYIQMAKHMGNTVVVFSHSDEKEKEEDAKKFGADDFITFEENYDDFKKYEKSFDLIVCTANAQLNWAKFLELVKIRGTFCLVGLIPTMTLALPVAQILQQEINFTSSKVGSSADLAEMLNFCAEHNITSEVEKIFDLENVQEAIDQFKEKGFHYRAVIKIPENSSNETEQAEACE